MNRFVLDTSVCLAWCFEDERGPEADRIFDLMESSEALVPAIWPIEIGNALFAGERRNRIAAAAVLHSLDLLRSLTIHVNHAETLNDVQGLVALARLHKLSIYDAAYLSLAMREDIPLATLDRALARAAKSAGLRVL